MNPFLLPFVQQQQQQQHPHPQRDLSFVQQQRQPPRDLSFIQQQIQPPNDLSFVQQQQQPPLFVQQQREPPRDISLVHQQRQPSRDHPFLQQHGHPPLFVQQFRHPPREHQPFVQQQKPKDHNNYSNHRDTYSNDSKESKSADGPNDRTPKQHERSKERPRGPKLPRSYEFTERDVCCGRGKKNWNLPGNTIYRDFIQDRVGMYIEAKSKREKTMYISDLVQELRGDGYQFLKEDKNGLLFDMGDREAREKVAHCLRDQVTAIRQKKKDLGHFAEAKARLRAHAQVAVTKRQQASPATQEKEPRFPQEHERRHSSVHQSHSSPQTMMEEKAMTSEPEETVYVDYWIQLE